MAAPFVFNSPPNNSIVVPGKSIALLDKKCTTPETTFGPYNAEAAPRTTSIFAMSILDKPECCVKNVDAAGVDKNR